MAIASLVGHGHSRRATRKITPSREETLTNLIEKYYEMNEEKRALEKAQRELQQQIAEMLPIPVDEREVIFVADDLEAAHYYPTVRSIAPYALHQYDPELVWRLCNVPLGAAEQALPADVFHEMVSVRYSDVPQLRIRKRVSAASKRERQNED